MFYKQASQPNYGEIKIKKQNSSASYSPETIKKIAIIRKMLIKIKNFKLLEINMLDLFVKIVVSTNLKIVFSNFVMWICGELQYCTV